MDKRVLDKLDKLEIIVEKIVTNMVTKDDARNFATKDDLRNFATKDDLKILKEDLIREIRDTEAFAVVTVDKHKAEKTVVEDLDRRVTKLERKVFV